METTENDERIVLQPETELEQQLLAELFTRLNNVAEAPTHPTNVGSQLIYYTLDLGVYDDLNLDLWREAECGVDESGRLDPEAGSRALVVIHTQGDDESVSEGEATQEQVDEAVESLAEDNDGGENEHNPSIAEMTGRIEGRKPLDEDVDYDELQDLAKDASTTGLMDIPANQSTEDLIDELRTYVVLATEQSSPEAE